MSRFKPLLAGQISLRRYTGQRSDGLLADLGKATLYCKNQPHQNSPPSFWHKKNSYQTDKYQFFTHNIS
jgi:hypothetical protein